MGLCHLLCRLALNPFPGRSDPVVVRFGQLAKRLEVYADLCRILGGSPGNPGSGIPLFQGELLRIYAPFLFLPRRHYLSTRFGDQPSLQILKPNPETRIRRESEGGAFYFFHLVLVAQGVQNPLRGEADAGHLQLLVHAAAPVHQEQNPRGQIRPALPHHSSRRIAVHRGRYRLGYPRRLLPAPACYNARPREPRRSRRTEELAFSCPASCSTKSPFASSAKPIRVAAVVAFASVP